jgi:hypothetical protein
MIAQDQRRRYARACSKLKIRDILHVCLFLSAKTGFAIGTRVAVFRITTDASNLRISANSKALLNPTAGMHSTYCAIRTKPQIKVADMKSLFPSSWPSQTFGTKSLLSELNWQHYRVSLSPSVDLFFLHCSQDHFSDGYGTWSLARITIGLMRCSWI